MEQYLDSLEKAFIANQDPKKAAEMKAYLKGQFEFYGIQAPQRKKISASLLNKYTPKSEQELISFITTLWEKPQREFQYSAIEFLKKNRKLLSDHSTDFFTYLVLTKSWWDTIDNLDNQVIGWWLLKYPSKKENFIETWLQSQNMWQQRVCIIHQLLYKQKTDKDLLLKCIVYCIDSNEFFIQKAIGWALRQYAKTNPTWVIHFIDQNPELKPLSVREAKKHL